MVIFSQSKDITTIKENQDFLEKLMKTQPDQFQNILNNKKQFETQIIYTQINRDQHNTPTFKSFQYNVDDSRYFYPASTVKMPTVFMALEFLNTLRIPGLNANTTMLTDSAYQGQSAVKEDLTAENNLPSPIHYAKKIFLVSDNDAFNRLFELLGHDYLNNKLHEKGYEKTRITHRLAISMPGDGGLYTNPVSFWKGNQVLFEKPLLKSQTSYAPENKTLKGKGFINGSGELVKEKFDFTYKNFMPLSEMHDMLKAVIFPEAVSLEKRFHLSEQDYELLYGAMSELPRESDFPQYNKEDYNDSYSKFLLFGAKEAIPDHIRVFNKIGQAYGYLTDNAYIIDTKNNVEFMLSAVIHTNANEIYNDGVYEYDSIGLPFMQDLGQLIYNHELERDRKFVPDLSKFKLVYDSAETVAEEFAPNLNANYHLYHEPLLDFRRIKYNDIEPFRNTIASQDIFEIENLGKSVEGRNINLIKAGKGAQKVILWSQMHGDESTATRALFEIFNFLSADDALNGFRENILSKTTLYFIPMLNPDGAEAFQRQNALSIDLNRDALRLSSPESKILKQVRDKYEPDFGFNLHDQSKYYNVSNTEKTASISFLAPAYNYEKDINEGRGNAMKLIVKMNEMLQEYIPGQVGRYDDAFEPRAFGDNIQKWGTNTILIESGGTIGDPEKLKLVKMNFMAILYALNEIANSSYTNANINSYEDIPKNDRNFYDLLIRNGHVLRDGKSYKMDLGIFLEEKMIGTTVATKTSVAEMGDLSIYYGYEEVDAEGLEMQIGKVFPEILKNINDIEQDQAYKWLAQGYTTVRLTHPPSGKDHNELPLFFVNEEYQASELIALGTKEPLLFLKNDEVQFVIVNGEIISLR